MSTQSVILNKKLERLRSQYERNISDMEQMRSRYEGEISDRIQNARNEMQLELENKNQMLKAEYDEKFNSFYEFMTAQLNSSAEELSREYARLKNENDNMREEMQHIEAELMAEVKGLGKKFDDEEERKKIEASGRMEKAYDDFQEFSVKYPHEFFEPSAAHALLMQMETSKTDFRSGFYEACMANSSNTEFQITMLKERMEKSLEQWKRYFNLLEAYTLKACEFVASEEFRTIKNEKFCKELSEKSEREADTFDFWSYGEYSNILSQLQEYKNFAERISAVSGNTKDEKIVKFLKSEAKNEDKITFDVLADRLEKLTAIHKKLCTLRVFIQSGFTASFVRATELAKNTINLFSVNRGAVINKKEFRDNDIRKEFVIKAAEPGKNISVNIFPVFPDNMTVVNCIGVYIEHTGSGTPENLKATEKNIITALTQISGDIPVFFESSLDGTAESEKVMENLKIQADEMRKKQISLQRRR